jgi:hypothetical protein
MIHARPDYMRFQEPALENPELLSVGSTPIAEDEPVMLFRARDALFIDVLRHYAELLEQCGSAPHMIKAVYDQIELALDWRNVNGSYYPDIPRYE